jgi:hypothetical protein
MRRLIPLLTAGLLTSCSTIWHGQSPVVDSDNIRHEDVTTELEISEFDSDQFEDEPLGDEMEDVLLTLEELSQSPVNVNTATFDDLMRIPAMRPTHARAILRQRSRLGRFSNKGQYWAIPGVPSSVMLRIAPYMTLGSAAETIRNTLFEPDYWTAGLRLESLTRVRATLEKSDGYRSDLPNRDRVYPGPPLERYQRVSIRSQRFKAGVQLRGSQGATGLASQTILNTTHFGLYGLPFVQNVNAGRYRLAYGMGLSMGGGRAPRRGFDMRIPRGSKTTISPYSGSSYNLGHNGIALSTGEKLRLTYWMSSRGYSGTSADSSGLRWSMAEPQFRTRSEIDRRDNFSVRLVGLRGAVRSGKYQFGLAGWTANSTENIVPTSELYEGIGLRGRRFAVLSADVDANYRMGSLSAEIAFDAQAGKAAIIAGEASLGRGVEILSIGRYYGSNYQSPFGSTFSSWSGRPSNEAGWFISMSVQPNRQTTYALYNDLYSSILPRGGDYMPTSGNELGVKLTRSFGQAEVHFIYRNRTRDEESDKMDLVDRAYRHQYRSTRSSTRIEIITSLSQRATWVTRAEWVWAAMEAGSASRGYLIHQDLSWWISSITRLQARVTIYNSDSHTSRLYAWEPDVGLASAMPSYQGEGSRQYILATFKPNSFVEGKIKLARTHMPFEYTIGSGNDQIQDNKRTQLHTSLLIRI